MYVFLCVEEEELGKVFFLDLLSLRCLWDVKVEIVSGTDIRVWDCDLNIIISVARATGVYSVHQGKYIEK